AKCSRWICRMRKPAHARPVIFPSIGSGISVSIPIIATRPASRFAIKWSRAAASPKVTVRMRWRSARCRDAMSATAKASFIPALRNRPETAVAQAIGRYALRSLHVELVLYPKPGLVSLRDNGAHHDMNAATFMRSIFALRRYFGEIAMAGMRAAPMSELRRLGLIAESRMLRATRGVNTHRGAIFALGMLAAAAGRAWREECSLSDTTLREMIATHWRR